jgi:hypothetical protein
MHTAELANGVPSPVGASLSPRNQQLRCARRSDDTDAPFVISSGSIVGWVGLHVLTPRSRRNDWHPRPETLSARVMALGDSLDLAPYGEGPGHVPLRQSGFAAQRGSVPERGVGKVLGCRCGSVPGRWVGDVARAGSLSSGERGCPPRPSSANDANGGAGAAGPARRPGGRSATDGLWGERISRGPDRAQFGGRLGRAVREPGGGAVGPARGPWRGGRGGRLRSRSSPGPPCCGLAA